MALLSCSSISLELGGRGILEDVNLEVEQAEVVGLAGPNGAGKTSLFEVLSGRQLRPALLPLPKLSRHRARHISRTPHACVWSGPPSLCTCAHHLMPPLVC